ncbi:hypothetical protein BD626DRAFT_503993 [Schizophyllum amplum]|uniref:Uncharacterized protein n=1 Tax=Schizophyllum amplum TaxID=97359 RepID=A0A550C7R5_9AGAR|nr:hypothetical protein BD626DRAFT_503993 [Auriculariopsis ampla]
MLVQIEQELIDGRTLYEHIAGHVAIFLEIPRAQPRKIGHRRDMADLPILDNHAGLKRR